MAKKIFFNGLSSTNLKSRGSMIPTVSRAPFTSMEWVYFYHNGVINSKNKQILPSKSISSSISKSSLIMLLVPYLFIPVDGCDTVVCKYQESKSRILKSVGTGAR